MADEPNSKDLEKAVQKLDELYKQGKIDTLVAQMTHVYDRVLNALSRDMMDGVRSAETPMDKVVKARLSAQAWKSSLPAVWKHWEDKYLSQIEATWNKAYNVKPTALKPLTQHMLDQFKGAWPKDGQPASGLAGRFFHLTDEAQQTLTDGLARSVFTGQSDRQVERYLQDAMKVPKKRAKAVLRDAHMQYARGVELAYAAETGEEYFLYYGPNDDVTRPFCAKLEGKILSKDEINALDNGQTGPGTVMIAGGGYNCRHHWRPVRRAWYDDGEWERMRDGRADKSFRER